MGLDAHSAGGLAADSKMCIRDREGLLHTQRTSGRFVTEDRDRIMSIKEDLAKELAAGFLQSMKELGYSDSQAITMLESASREKEEPARCV